MSQQFVSVIIPTLNDSARLRQCLSMLENQTYPKHLYEVIVVDNNSKEDIKGLVDSFNQARITHENRKGSYAARNKGISIAKGTILGFTDSDCLPAADWVEKGVEKLSETYNCGLVAGNVQIFFKDPKNPTVVEIYDSMNFLRQKHYVENFKFGATANVFTYKKVFETVGLFNSELKSGGDSEWGKRVFLAGFVQAYADDVLVMHPARYQWKDIQRKAVRVTEGLYRQGKERKSLADFTIEILRDLKSPFKELSRTFGSKYPAGLIQKMKLMILVVSLRHLRARTKVKLYLEN